MDTGWAYEEWQGRLRRPCFATRQSYDASEQYPTIPKTANTGAVKNLRSATKAYEAIAIAFEQTDRRKLEAEVQEGRDIFSEVNLLAACD